MKIFIKIFLIVFVFFVSFNIVFALSSSSVKYFGGTIKKIENIETDGFTCDKKGNLLQIKSKKYFIPSNVKPVTKYEPKNNQQILGKYKMELTVLVCKKEKDEGKFETKTFLLPQIIYFGTSKR